MLDDGGGPATTVGTARADPPLRAGEEVVAAPGAIAEIVHFDGSLTRLDSGASASAVPSDPSTGRPQIELRLGPGRSWHAVAETAERGERYSVTSRGVRATARHATFVVEASDGGATTVTVVDGTVVVRSAAGQVALGGGDGVAVASSGRFGRPTTLPKDDIERDDWVSMNRRLDRGDSATGRSDSATGRERPWRVGVIGGVAVAAALLSLAVGRTGSTSPAPSTATPRPHVAIVGTPAIAPPPPPFADDGFETRNGHSSVASTSTSTTLDPASRTGNQPARFGS